MFPLYKSWCAVPPKKRLDFDKEPDLDSFTDKDPASGIFDITRKKYILGKNIPRFSETYTEPVIGTLIFPDHDPQIHGNVGTEEPIHRISAEYEKEHLRTTSSLDCKVNLQKYSICKTTPELGSSPKEANDEVPLCSKDIQRSKNNTKSKPKCAKCRNHGFITNLAGHKGSCPFTKCECSNCALVDERRLLNSHALELKYKLTKNTAIVRPIPIKGKNGEYINYLTNFNGSHLIFCCFTKTNLQIK